MYVAMRERYSMASRPALGRTSSRRSPRDRQDRPSWSRESRRSGCRLENFQSKFCHRVVGKVLYLFPLISDLNIQCLAFVAKISLTYIEKTLRLQSDQDATLLIGAKVYLFIFILFFWLDGVDALLDLQTDRLINRTRLQTDRPKVRVGLVGLLTTLADSDK